MSRPKNNKVWCPDCGRKKMFFESESKAKNFIKWNGDEIDTHGGELRPYYCPSCCGWHISSKPHKETYEHNTERLIKAYERSLTKNKTRLGGILLGKKNWRLVEIAEDVWRAVPNDIKDSTEKKPIKKFITEYLAERNLEENDGGNMRTKVYALWEKHIREKG